MYRQKIIMLAAAGFAIGAAFAAQTTSVKADRQRAAETDHWVPGTNMVMSAHDAGSMPLPPPR